MSSAPLSPRSLFAVLAVLYALATAAYSVVWMRDVRFEPRAELGIAFDYRARDRSLAITEVLPGSPAERAGVQEGDEIQAVGGRPLPGPYIEAVVRGQPGDRVDLAVTRPGQPPFTARAVLAARRQEDSPPLTIARLVAIRTVNLYPVPFAILVAVLLYLRSTDRRAWLLALLFGSLIAGAPLLPFEAGLEPVLRGFALAYKTLLGALSPALFYAFFTVFPAPLPLDRRWPWLKWWLLLPPLAIALPLAVWVLLAGGSYPLLLVADRLEPVASPVGFAYSLAGLGLGLISLLTHARRGSHEVRRKTRVIVWGTAVGITPAFVLTALSGYLHRELGDFPFWVWAPSVMALFLMPLSFAYALLKHRVLEVPVLLRRSARYVLVQHGFLALTFLLGLGTTLAFARAFSRFAEPRTEATLPVGIALGVGLGVLLASAGAELERRGIRRLDRAFFRSAYDARQILEDLARSARAAGDCESLAALLEKHLREALHPRRLAVYFRTVGDQLELAAGEAPEELRVLGQELPVLGALAAAGRPVEVPPEKGLQPWVALEALESECLVPLLDRGDRLTGLLALGPRLSEESYSGEDKRLLAAVALQAGLALENILLAETMAARMEAERRAGHEMEIARQVQSQLLPQRRPQLDTLEYAGRCLQARAVGGDYFDYLDSQPGRLGLVLADVSGKGISAALLMANLQANLRSQYAVAAGDLKQLLRSVNRLFFESTAPRHYATLFLGEYDDASRRLRYGNCGHNPPLILRAGGEVQTLEVTAAAVGLLDQWDCGVEEVQLHSGDLLVLYSDGVTEAMSDDGEEFGEERLLEAVRVYRDRPAAELLEGVVDRVQVWSGVEQEDDLTLMVARVL
jgi:sigma-B regulation protein RsbU (phosphoserine phosphatase)